MKTIERPELNDKISAADFKDFYWLTDELIAFCKSKGINAAGGKQKLAKRIILYLKTGKIVKTNPKKRTKSKFDWNHARINFETKITDNYRNTENVRAFMRGEIGPHFRLNTAYMNWAKQNVGKTMKEAVTEWKRIYKLKKRKKIQTVLPSQFEYHAYVRDFTADNKGKTLTDAVKYWKLKRNQRGSNVYSKDDLKLTE